VGIVTLALVFAIASWTVTRAFRPLRREDGGRDRRRGPLPARRRGGARHGARAAVQLAECDARPHRGRLPGTHGLGGADAPLHLGRLP
jgi:hypothetical protein